MVGVIRHHGRLDLTLPPNTPTSLMLPSHLSTGSTPAHCRHTALTHVHCHHLPTAFRYALHTSIPCHRCNACSPL
eukprot:63276-Chlamydomonas_euryale.AAC.2